MRQNKTIIIRFKITEEELATLESLMAMAGFRNRSNYIRKCVLGGRVNVRRNFRKTEANLTKQVLLLRTEIRKIGINYNQVVRSLNTFAKLRDKRGNAVVSEITVHGHLKDLKSMMEKALSKVEAIARDVIDSETDPSAPEDSDNYH